MARDYVHVLRLSDLSRSMRWHRSIRSGAPIPESLARPNPRPIMPSRLGGRSQAEILRSSLLTILTQLAVRSSPNESVVLMSQGIAFPCELLALVSNPEQNRRFSRLRCKQ